MLKAGITHAIFVTVFMTFWNSFLSYKWIKKNKEEDKERTFLLYLFLCLAPKSAGDSVLNHGFLLEKNV